jgi:hypothetical protein
MRDVGFLESFVWCVFIKEHGPKFAYIKGQDNILADFFNRTPLAEGKEAPGPFGPTHANKQTKRYGSWMLRNLTILKICYSTVWDNQVFRECYSFEVKLEGYVNVKSKGDWNPVNYQMLKCGRKDRKRCGGCRKWIQDNICIKGLARRK